jgi:hypothetical protein
MVACDDALETPDVLPHLPDTSKSMTLDNPESWMSSKSLMH